MYKNGRKKRVFKRGKKKHKNRKKNGGNTVMLLFFLLVQIFLCTSFTTTQNGYVATRQHLAEAKSGKMLPLLSEIYVAEPANVRIGKEMTNTKTYALSN